MTDESVIRTVRLDGETFFDLDRYVHYASKMVQGGRKSQQDSMFAGINGEYFLGVICDGMGGMKGGEQASALAVQMLAEQFYEETLEDIPLFLKNMAYTMDDAVYQLEKNGKRLQAGSTVVAVVMDECRLHWLSVGDSKLYLYRKGEMICPIQEHNYGMILNEKMINGQMSEEEYLEEMKRGNALISYLGLGGISRMELNVSPFFLESGDQILLCSDGLYRSVAVERIREILSQNSSEQEKADILVEEAKKNGGEKQDNTSVIIISRC